MPTLVALSMQMVLPIDTYKKDVDELVDPEYNYDWESLRASISEHGFTALNTVCSNAIGEQFRCVKRNKWNPDT